MRQPQTTSPFYLLGLRCCIVAATLSAGDGTTMAQNHEPAQSQYISDDSNTYEHAMSLWDPTNSSETDRSSPPESAAASGAMDLSGTALSNRWSASVYGSSETGSAVDCGTSAAFSSEPDYGIGGSGQSECGPCSWGQFDVLLWNMDGYATPPLITTAPGNVVLPGAATLGNAATRILYGNQELGDDLRLGGRLQFGRWLDDCRETGIQAEFLGFGADTQSATFTGNGADIFARPFYNTNPAVDAQDAHVFAMPGLSDGSVRFNTSSEIYSIGTSLRFNIDGGGQQTNCCPSAGRVDLLLGYRFFRLEERFTSREMLLPTGAGFVPGTSIELNDSIRTRNDFHGLELGLNRIIQRGSWMWDVSALCALGEVERVVDLNGSTRVIVPGVGDDTFAGAFFNGPRDIGRFRDNDFAAIPQVRANLSRCFGCHWRMSVGYNFAYLSSAFRPGQFLNTEFDGTRLGQDVAVNTVRRPDFRTNDLLLHGTNVGLSYSY